MYVAKKDVKDAAESLQVYAGQEAGLEAAIHAIYVVYHQDETKAVLLMPSVPSIGRRCFIISVSPAL